MDADWLAPFIFYVSGLSGLLAGKPSEYRSLDIRSNINENGSHYKSRNRDVRLHLQGRDRPRYPRSRLARRAHREGPAARARRRLGLRQVRELRARSAVRSAARRRPARSPASRLILAPIFA